MPHYHANCSIIQGSAILFTNLNLIKLARTIDSSKTTRKHSRRMPTVRLSTVRVLVAATRCHYRGRWVYQSHMGRGGAWWVYIPILTLCTYPLHIPTADPLHIPTPPHPPRHTHPPTPPPGQTHLQKGPGIRHTHQPCE